MLFSAEFYFLMTYFFNRAINIIIGMHAETLHFNYKGTGRLLAHCPQSEALDLCEGHDLLLEHLISV